MDEKARERAEEARRALRAARDVPAVMAPGSKPHRSDELRFIQEELCPAGIRAIDALLSERERDQQELADSEDMVARKIRERDEWIARYDRAMQNVESLALARERDRAALAEAEKRLNAVFAVLKDANKTYGIITDGGESVTPMMTEADAIAEALGVHDWRAQKARL